VKILRILGVSQLVFLFFAGSAAYGNKASWTEYMSGMQALDADPITAMHYFDLALDEIYSEQQQDSLKLPEDSIYFATMPMRIILTLESLYPKLIEQANFEQAYSIQSDFESFDDFEETPLDSTEKEAIENFLDTMDLSKFSLPVVINDRVMREIHFLTVNVRKFTSASLSRKTALDSMIYSKLRKRGMPEDLIYLALVESGFKVSAYSKAKAAGVWQFIPGTGKRYGLSVDFWLDKRHDPEASTDAALDYLSALYKEFGDWHLAMAAYNCGEGKIRKLVREELAVDLAKKVSYWDLQLPSETMHYVPRILAATIIGHFPEHYSFKVEKQNPIPFDTVTVKDCIPLDKVGSAVGANVNTIRDLNPELTRWCTPPNLKTYTMKVPAGTRNKFLKAYAKMDKSQLVRWQQYKVQRGNSLGYIAGVFGLKVSDIQAANNLKNLKLRVGQVLIIPMPPGATAPSAKKNAKKNETLAKSTSGTSYEIKPGDSLWDIARNHNVTIQQLLEWNPGLDKKIHPGMKIKIGK
jgi:membrane-bound lytic murein transglycosylase D